jgi:pimeloyl-ACP methyl ester carboxylesterase
MSEGTGLAVDDDPRGVTLPDCVDALVDQVERTDRRDVRLVGHSWGGYVVAGAAPGLPPG